MRKVSKSLPFHGTPFPDELLSSWMVRLSMGNACKLHTFWTSFSHTGVWARDIDRTVSDGFLTKLTTLSSEFSEVNFAQHTFRSFDYQNDGGISRKGTSSLILPVGVYHRTRNKPGMQFCCRCLLEDREPYFRIRWRHVYQFCCLKHKCYLQNSCHHCGHVVNFHRLALDDFKTLAICHRCSNSLSKVITCRAPLSVLKAQRLFDSVFSRKWVLLKGERIYIVPFIQGVHQLMKQILSFTTTEQLMKAIPELTEEVDCENIILPTEYGSVEHVHSIEKRALACCIVVKLLTNWPANFINLFIQLGWKSREFRHREMLPYWLKKVLQEQLNFAPYRRNKVEIYSAGKALVKMNPHATACDLAKLLGTSSYDLERNGFVDLSDALVKGTNKDDRW